MSNVDPQIRHAASSHLRGQKVDEVTSDLRRATEAPQISSNVRSRLCVRDNNVMCFVSFRKTPCTDFLTLKDRAISRLSILS